MTPLIVALFLTQQQPKPQKIVFDEPDLVTGDLKTPDADIIETSYRPVFGNLIKVRKNFDDKIVKSVEQM